MSSNSLSVCQSTLSGMVMIARSGSPACRACARAGISKTLVTTVTVGTPARSHATESSTLLDVHEPHLPSPLMTAWVFSPTRRTNSGGAGADIFDFTSRCVRIGPN